jgi:deoxycytidylate deaminase
MAAAKAAEGVAPGTGEAASPAPRARGPRGREGGAGGAVLAAIPDGDAALAYIASQPSRQFRTMMR